PGSGEDCTWNRARGSNLSAIVGLDLGSPFGVPGIQAQGGQSSTWLLQRVINALAIGRATENNQAQRGWGRLIQGGPPQPLSVVVGIQGDCNAALPGSKQNVTAIIETLQDHRGSAEIPVGPQLLRAIATGRTAIAASDHERIACEFLMT